MKKLLLLSLLALLTLSGAVCKTVSKDIQEAIKPKQLVYWRVFDDSDAFSELIGEYNQMHPNVTIVYRKLRFEEFEKTLIDALAEDRGPDIFSIHNTWMGGYQSKLLPLPPVITIPIRTVSGGLKKEAIWNLENKKSLSLRELQNNFVDQVKEDVVLKTFNSNNTVTEDIYGLPLSVDTMVLYYNKELLNSAGIAEPASDWQTLQEHVQKLTKQDSQGNITIAGAAIGSADNIERSIDILSLLMMQNGTIMTDENGFSKFHEVPAGLESRAIAPGQEALIFYTDFASPQKQVYTWNETMPNSLDAFIQGKVAYFFGYSYHLSTIKARAPKLQFSITTVPQISGNKPVNFANYWVEVVSKKTQHPNEAWDFIQFINNVQNIEKYLNKTKKPTALRALIQKQSDDIDLAPFVSQLLTAKSWYKGKNAPVAEEAFKQMIKDILLGTRDVREAINIVANKVNQTIQ